MTKASDNLFPKLVMEEVATDGSATTTPAADHRALFLGEDGALHLKDSAAAVTGVGADLGAWTDYTPTWSAAVTPPVVGNGTIEGRFKLLDSKTGLFIINLVLGTTSTAGSGGYRMSLPAGWTGHASLYQIVHGHVLDAGTHHYPIVGKIDPGDDEVTEIIYGGASNNGLVAHNSPMSWTTGDQLNLTGVVEIQ